MPRLLAPVVALLCAGACDQGTAPWPDDVPAMGALPADGADVVYGFLRVRSTTAADAMLADRWTAGRNAPVELHLPLRWDEDPTGEKFFRFEMYGLRPLVPLIEEWRATGDVRYRDRLVAVLEDFVAHAPIVAGGSRAATYLFDPHTAANRAMVLVHAYVALVRGGALAEDAPLARALRVRLGALGDFLARDDNWQDDSNHGFAEATALLLLAASFPDWPAAPGWRDLALARHQRLALEMIGDDGVLIENAPSYHLYVLDQLLDLAEWADRAGVDLPADVDRRIAGMIDATGALADPDGRLPAFGASRAGASARSVLGDRLDAIAARDPVAAWLIGGGASGAPPTTTVRAFASSGFVVLRSPAATAAELATSAHVVVDAGPYRTNHSDLDALSLTLTGAGRPLVVDGGFFSLEPGPWHDYFHGTRGHSTVIVDGADQEEGGATIERVARGDGGSVVAARHGLYDGVAIRRTVALLGATRLVVIDDVRGAAGRALDLPWHLAGDLTTTVAGAGFTAVDGRGRPVLAATTVGGDLTVVRGAGAARSGDRPTAPLDGWVCDYYERARPADVVHLRGRTATAAPVRFVTVFAWGAAVGEPMAVDTADPAGEGAVVVSAGSERWRVMAGPLAGAEALGVR